MSVETPHYTYFTVTGRYLRRIVDGADEDRLPDVVPSTGTFKFEPSVTTFKDLSIPATFDNVVQTGSLDSAGFLVDEQGRPGVVLMSGNSPHVSPQGWTWKVTPSINGKQGSAFNLPADIEPGSTVDLTIVSPAAGGSQGVVIIVSEASRVAAEAARDQAVEAAESLLAGLEDAIEAYLIENPPEGGGAVDSVNGQTGIIVLTAADLGAVPTTRTVAGKALSANITLVKADVGLGNVDNTTDAGKPISTATQTALNAKAATSHTHTASQVTDLGTFVDDRIEGIIGAAPAALDTLDEIAAALGDDANFAATVTTNLALKANTSDLTSRASLGLSRPEIRADSSTTCPDRTAWIATNCPGYSGPVLWHTGQFVAHPGPSTAIDGDDWARRIA